MTPRKTPDTHRQEKVVRYIARRLVDHPDDIRLERRVEGATVVLELTVARDDVGRVIGKNGQVAESMRMLIGVITPPQDRVILKIV